MRLAQLNLTRYGHFTDRSLNFPKTAVDLHLVVGPNEAGKSTLRQAVLDLFYGIPVRTPLGFKHAMTEMVLGGVLENAGASFTFQRFKRTKNPLIGADGQPFTEVELLKWLGGTDRAFYERNFALDHPTLVAGAREILTSTGDVGQVLIQAAGLPGLHKLLTTLEAEAYALWGERRRGEAAYYAALKRMEDAEARLREVSVSSHKWLTAKRALDNATGAAAVAQEAYRTADIRRERLERIRRVRPALQELRTAQEQRAALATPALLPKDAAITLATAESEVARAEVEIQLLGPRLKQEAAALKAVQRNPALLAHKDAIQSLAGRVTEYLTATSDLPLIRGQFDAKLSAVRGFARQVGWVEAELKEVNAKVPTRLVRAEIEALLRNQTTVNAEVERSANAEKDQIAALKLLDDQIAASRALPHSLALDAALGTARALDLAQAESKARQKVMSADSALQTALAALAPWSGTLDELRALALPHATEVQRISKQRDGLEARGAVANEELRAKRTAAARAKVAADDARRDDDMVTEAALLEQRRRRDDLWQAMRAGQKHPATEGDPYVGEIVATDTRAARRYLKAEVVANAQMLDTQYRSLEAEIGVQEGHATEATKALTTLLHGWAAQMTALGVPGLGIDQFPAWTKARETALQAARAKDAADDELADLLKRASSAATELCDALTKAGDTDPTDGLDLATLVRRAESFDAEQMTLRAELKGLQGQKTAIAQTLPALTAKTASAVKAQTQWKEDWKQQIAAAGLAADIGAAGAETALAMFAQMETTCATLLDLQQTRLTPMETATERFITDARDLAATCLPELVPQPPPEIAAGLSEGLRLAQQADADHERLTAAVAITTGAYDKAVEDGKRALATIAPLLGVAKVATLDELRAAITLADACRAAEQRATDAERAALIVGDGLPLEWLADEVDAVDPAEVAGQLADALTERAAAESRRDECIRLRTQVEDAFGKIAGQDDAARAESMRQDALMAMGDAVDEYVRITVGAKLLKRAVERYREEKQGPLLRQASGLFSQLTCGAFEKLSLDFDVEPVALTAHRVNGGGMVNLTGLSTGTEDQLYLALRLAALQLHLEGAPALPFIADDIVIHMDTARTGAAFAALATLATKTQVLVLSHDENIIETAKRATDGKVQVHQL